MRSIPTSGAAQATSITKESRVRSGFMLSCPQPKGNRGMSKHIARKKVVAALEHLHVETDIQMKRRELVRGNLSAFTNFISSFSLTGLTPPLSPIEVRLAYSETVLGTCLPFFPIDKELRNECL
ncbi:UNVERIFIED_CONTAM: hypothetical protein Scaly_2983600 [Sesamum calycinum]|uniref:Uncharacterized protein n=1 Tax=Sesamum calycinum TaxID=2727403 RepID=A0AAW2KKP2_9LAMI